MTREARIRAALQAGLTPELLEIRDDSAKHAGHAGAQPGGETHYHIIVSSQAMNGLSRVAAHRKIYGLLDAEFKSGLHALSIELC